MELLFWILNSAHAPSSSQLKLKSFPAQGEEESKAGGSFNINWSHSFWIGAIEQMQSYK